MSSEIDFSTTMKPVDMPPANSPEAAQNLASHYFANEVANALNGDAPGARAPGLAPTPTEGTTCIKDGQGYIDCGPIVGYSRPDGPALPENPRSPDAPSTPSDPWRRVGGVPTEGGGVPEHPLESPPKIIQWPRDPKFE